MQWAQDIDGHGSVLAVTGEYKVTVSEFAKRVADLESDGTLRPCKRPAYAKKVYQEKRDEQKA